MNATVSGWGLALAVALLCAGVALLHTGDALGAVLVWVAVGLCFAAADAMDRWGW